MKQKLYWNLFFLAMLGCSSKGQQFSNSSVPSLKTTDFKGIIPSNSKSVAHTECYVSYKIKNIQNIGPDKNFVDYALQSIMLKKLSWIDLSKLRDSKKLNYLLEHERGHLLISNILAYQATKKMSKIYNGDYISQASKIFNNELVYIRALELRYDQETQHSINEVEQKRWNFLLKAMLPK